MLYDIYEVGSISRISMFIERHGAYYFSIFLMIGGRLFKSTLFDSKSFPLLRPHEYLKLHNSLKFFYLFLYQNHGFSCSRMLSLAWLKDGCEMSSVES